MALVLVDARYDDVVVRKLTREVQAEYRRLYGGDGDSSVIHADQFAPPHGIFLVALVDDEPVGMGGWRRGGPETGDAEIKRMFVRSSLRRSGIARALLEHLISEARDAGLRRLVLETGTAQPEAIALYRAAGFVDVPAFGHYADEPDAVHLALTL